MDWISMLVQIGGSELGAAAAAMDKAQVMQLIKSVVDEYGKIDIPKLKELVLSKQKDTELSKVKDDPRYRADQASADAQLNDVINSGGLTLSDRAALNRVMARSARAGSDARGSIEQGMASRGALDSGAQLAMQLERAQSTAQAAADAGENTAATAQRRMYDAIQQRAQNAGAGLDRTNRMQSDAARAQDAINQGNTAILNTASKWNSGLPQQEFENKLTLAKAKAQPTYALSGAHAANAKDKQQRGDAIGGMGASAVNSIGNQGNGTNKGSMTGESTRPAVNRKQKNGRWYVQDFEGDWVAEGAQ